MFDCNQYMIPDPEELTRKIMSPIGAAVHHLSATQNFWAGYIKYLNEFLLPYTLASSYFTGVENLRIVSSSPEESMKAYMDLLEFIADLTSRGVIGEMNAVFNFHNKEMVNAVTAFYNTVFNLEGEDMETFMKRQEKMANLVANVYPQAIDSIEPQFGFHFERGRDEKVDETDRFILYRISPTKKDVEIDMGAKPILIIPPYVLGANILAFLPDEDRSYTHYFANHGIPTYIRIMKKIDENPGVQVMTGEDDARDTARFCKLIRDRHKKPVTLNGYCQGGFTCLCVLLTGELDGLVDALLTCVSPMDGTRSTGLNRFLKSLPTRFNDLDYGTKTLPNGNKVADGQLMGWVYKLKSIEKESPLVAYYRDMMMLSPNATSDNDFKISKTALALNYWLNHERSDIPLEITRMSFNSYNYPITSDGVLPVRMFDRELNLNRLREKKIKWLLCYGMKDDLVEPETALAPTEFVDVEVSGYPKGHVAIATSWSNPRSEYALHTTFGDPPKRGPVLFQIELNEELEKEKAKKAKAKAAASKKTKSTSKTTSTTKAKTEKKETDKKKEDEE